MRVEVRHSCSPGNKKLSAIYAIPEPERLPSVSRTEVIRLLKDWGVSDETLERLTICFIFSDIVVECYGLYLGNRGGEHKIYINHRIAGALPHMLNPTLIHELRHLYWEIRDPGRDHEKDCYDAEVSYKDFILATFD